MYKALLPVCIGAVFLSVKGDEYKRLQIQAYDEDLECICMSVCLSATTKRTAIAILVSSYTVLPLSRLGDDGVQSCV
jgi:hypothetical protein